MTRSMSDEQMQTRYGYDKEPMIGDGLRRTLHKCHENPPCVLAPRPECIPSPDPASWISSVVIIRLSGVLGRHVHYFAGDQFKPRPWGSFTPDPEFVRSEVNPILSWFRELWTPRFIGPLTMLGWISGDNWRWSHPEWTSEQVESARRVLTRLRNVTEAGK